MRRPTNNLFDKQHTKCPQLLTCLQKKKEEEEEIDHHTVNLIWLKGRLRKWMAENGEKNQTKRKIAV